MKTMVTILFAVLLLLVAAGLQAAEPAYDCSKASHEIEELICGNERLAALDRKMDEVYRQAMKALPENEKKKQKALQRGWIKGRNDCWKADDRAACVSLDYDQRITELQIISGQQIVPEPVEYRCDGGKYDSLTAVFYNETQTPAVVLTRVNASGDDQDIAYLRPSGSGAKYMGNKVEFWTKGKEAMGSWSGKTFKCREL